MSEHYITTTTTKSLDTKALKIILRLRYRTLVMERELIEPLVDMTIDSINELLTTETKVEKV